MKFLKAISNQDMFGHDVKLNFNRNGHEHKTLIGGIVSILVQMVLVAFVID